MWLRRKQTNKAKASILQIIFGSSLIIGLSACSGMANKEDVAIIKGEKSMLDEIYGVKTSSGVAVMTENIVLKYFPIGMHKQEILMKLKEMGFEYKVDKKENAIYVLYRNKPAYTLGSKTLEINFT